MGCKRLVYISIIQASVITFQVIYTLVSSTFFQSWVSLLTIILHHSLVQNLQRLPLASEPSPNSKAPIYLTSQSLLFLPMKHLLLKTGAYYNSPPPSTSNILCNFLPRHLFIGFILSSTYPQLQPLPEPKVTMFHWCYLWSIEVASHNIIAFFLMGTDEIQPQTQQQQQPHHGREW